MVDTALEQIPQWAMEKSLSLAMIAYGDSFYIPQRDAIARALVAERERAAKIVANLLSDLDDCNPDVGMGWPRSHFDTEAQKLLDGNGQSGEGE